jgi:hypothetical protein
MDACGDAPRLDRSRGAQGAAQEPDGGANFGFRLLTPFLAFRFYANPKSARFISSATTSRHRQIVFDDPRRKVRRDGLTLLPLRLASRQDGDISVGRLTTLCHCIH